MTILDRLFELMNERNLKPSQVTKDIGIANSSFSDWKKGKGSPSLDAVTKLAALYSQWNRNNFIGTFQPK